MKSLFERREKAASEEVRTEITSIISDIMEDIKEYAKRTADPLTPELGKESVMKLNLLAKIIGLESDEDWAPVAQIYQENLPSRGRKESN